MVSDKPDYGSFDTSKSTGVITAGTSSAKSPSCSTGSNPHLNNSNTSSRRASVGTTNPASSSSAAIVIGSELSDSESQVSINNINKNSARARPSSITPSTVGLSLDLGPNPNKTLSSTSVDNQRSPTVDETSRGARIRPSTTRLRNSSGNNNTTLSPGINLPSVARLSPTETIVVLNNPSRGGTTNSNGVTSSSVHLSNASSPMSTNSGDLLYQRQPLLQECENGLGWNDYDGEAPQELDTSLSSSDKRGGRSAVRIDIPSEPSVVISKRYPKEKRKTVIAFLVLCFNFVLATLSIALTHDRVPDRNVYKPLPDIILDNVQVQDWALDVSDILVAVSTVATSVVMLLHRHRWIVFRRVFLILACLYFMRSITIYVTVLPVSSFTYYCSPKSNSTSLLQYIKRVAQLVSGFGLSINGQHTYCGDYIYSGHTVILVTAYLFISEYTPRKLFYLHWASWIASCLGIIMMLISRGHYTVDVLIAYYVTTRIFWIYHTMANNSQLKIQNGQNGTTTNFLSRIWWFPLFRYMEGNVGGPLPRQYSFPWSSKEHRPRRSI